MNLFAQTRIETKDISISSVCFQGDALADWVSGGNTWTMPGEFCAANRNWGDGRLDVAVQAGTCMSEWLHRVSAVWLKVVGQQPEPQQRPRLQSCRMRSLRVSCSSTRLQV